MTREEAIQVLESMKSEENYNALIDLCNMAIEALSADAVQNMKAWNGLYIKVYADDDPQDKAEKLHQICYSNEALSEVAKCIQGYLDEPSAEAVPQLKQTDTLAIQDHFGQYKFCPNCGAKMDGGEE